MTTTNQTSGTYKHSKGYKAKKAIKSFMNNLGWVTVSGYNRREVEIRFSQKYMSRRRVIEIIKTKVAAFNVTLKDIYYYSDTNIAFKLDYKVN